MSERELRVLALAKYGELAASSRQRMVQYRQPLETQGILLKFAPLLSNEYVKSISAERGMHGWSVLQGYFRRVRQLLSLQNFDVAWVQCDLLPYVPGFLERPLLPNTIPIVYDCDDAIFHTYNLHKNPLVRRVLGRKLEPLLRRAKAATCGNDYLKAYAEQYCPNSAVVPTVVDTQIYRSRDTLSPERPARVTVGWIGSPSTWAYVKPLIPILRDLQAKNEISFRAVGVGANSRTIDQFEFADWTLNTEIKDIQQFDIGIMPLTDDPWSRGKCGYKLIQYMACGLPVIASPVGVNSKIVRHGENGFLASTEREWAQALATLIANPDLRARMGAAGRALVEKEYSQHSQLPRIAEILRSVAA